MNPRAAIASSRRSRTERVPESRLESIAGLPGGVPPTLACPLDADAHSIRADRTTRYSTMVFMGAPADDEAWVLAPYTEQHRQRAQEIISAHISGQIDLRDSLLVEYCTDESMLACFLDFFYASVVAGPPESGRPRFVFLQWMLGAVLVEIARSTGMDHVQLAITLMAEEVPALFPDRIALSIRAAQTTLASHLLGRSGGQPWGIETTLSAEGLSQLAAGVHVLLWMLCFGVREDVGDPPLIVALLPHLTKVLQLGADASGTTLDEFTHRLWLLHLQMDQGLIG